MKTIILAGGKGTRFSGLTNLIPKPLIKLNEKPIITHIVEHYIRYKFNKFIIPVGYKGNNIKEYFYNFDLHNSDLTVKFEKNKKKINFNKNFSDISFEIIDTGLNTLTALRLLKVKHLIKDKIFMLTYGDGISDVNLNNLLKFHKNHKRIATMTIVRPAGRFGEIEINSKSEINYFKEKPKLTKGWINGGFFVFNSEIFDYISDRNEMLEIDALNKLSANNELVGYKHEGFWQCIDTPRDLEIAENYMRDLNEHSSI